MHPVATGLILADDVDLFGAAALGNGDKVRSISGIFLGVGTTSMTLSFPASSKSSSVVTVELDGSGTL